MFAHIIGYPLKTPRSIKIWTSYFKKKKMNIKMSGYEIRPKNFNNKIKKLFQNNKFLASAVTMPYKEKIVRFIKFGDKISKYSKSVNLIIKHKSNIFGYNTDVLGAMKSLHQIKKKKILIFGFGGTGKAIYNVFSEVYKKTNFTIISSKNNPKLKRISYWSNKITKKNFDNLDIFINCSPLGSDLKSKFRNRTPVIEKNFKYLKKDTVIFDLVYKPKITKLNKLCKKYGIRYINGIIMNSVQADKALKIISKFYKNKFRN